MTTRPTRTEVLEAIEWIENSYAPALTAFAPNYILTMVEAARAYAGLAPDTCPACEGSGELRFGRIWQSGETVQVKYGTNIESIEVCLDCGGRGYVWPDKLIEQIGWTIGERHEIVIAKRVVVQVLDVLWEVGNDN